MRCRLFQARRTGDDGSPEAEVDTRARPWAPETSGRLRFPAVRRGTWQRAELAAFPAHSALPAEGEGFEPSDDPEAVSGFRDRKVLSRRAAEGRGAGDPHAASFAFLPPRFCHVFLRSAADRCSSCGRRRENPSTFPCNCSTLLSASDGTRTRDLRRDRPRRYPRRTTTGDDAIRAIPHHERDRGGSDRVGKRNPQARPPDVVAT
jgi:hypothetical protein